MPSRHLQDSSKYLVGVLQKCVQDVFKMSSRHLQNVLIRRLQNFFKAYHQVKLFLFLRRIQHVSDTYCKDSYLQKDLPGSYFWEIYGQCTTFSRVIRKHQETLVKLFMLLLPYQFLPLLFLLLSSIFTFNITGVFLKKFPANMSLDRRTWRLLEDLFPLLLQKIFKMSLQCLDQDDYICLSHISSADVFKTSWSQDQYTRLGHTFSRRFQNLLQKNLQDIFKTSSRYFEDVLKTSLKLLQENLQKRFQNISKMSWSRPIYSSWSYFFKASSRCLQDVLQKHLQDIFKTSCQDVFKTSSKHFQGILHKCLQDIFKTFYKDVSKTFSRHIVKLNCSC